MTISTELPRTARRRAAGLVRRGAPALVVGPVAEAETLARTVVAETPASPAWRCDESE
jgi:hypothetical protein